MSRVFLISANTLVEPFPVYPLGMASVAGALLANGHQVAQFDPLVQGVGEDALRSALRAFAPDVVGFSLRNIDNVDSLSADDGWSLGALRERVCWVRAETTAPVVLGGAGFSIMPEEILDFVGGDYGVVGPGEGIFLGLLTALATGRTLPKIWRTGPGENPIATSSTEPDPSLVAYYLEASGLLGISSKRGCPHACTYCTYPEIEGSCFFPKDPAEVAEEVEQYKRRFGATSYFFTDSVFNDPLGHYLKVAEEFCRRDLDIKWCAFFRPAGLKVEDLALLQRSGLYAAEMGTDATSDTTLTGLRKGFNFSEVAEVNRACASLRIPCAHYVMFGGPGETRETLREGLANLDRLEEGIIFAFSGIRILPGTSLHRRAVAEGVIAADHSLLRPVYYFSPGLDPSEMNAQIEEAFRGKRTWIFPPSQGQEKARLTRSLGFKGVLWNEMALTQWRIQDRKRERSR